MYQLNIIKKIKKDYKKTFKRHQNLSKEEKEKKWQYDHECYRNLSEHEKQKHKNLLSLEKKYRMRKNAFL